MSGHYVAKFSDEGPMGSSKANYEHLNDDMSRGFVLLEYPKVSIVSGAEPSLGAGLRPADIKVGDMELFTYFDKVGPRAMNIFYKGNVLKTLNVYELVDSGGQKAVVRSISAKDIHIVGILWQYNVLAPDPYSAENSTFIMQIRANNIEEAILSIGKDMNPAGNVAGGVNNVLGDLNSGS